MENKLNHNLRHRLNEYRFSIYLFTQLIILFGSLFIPSALYESFISPIFVVVNLVAGLFIIPLNSHFRKAFYLLVTILVGEFILGLFGYVPGTTSIYLRFFSYFIVYSVITYHLIQQIWRAEEVDTSMIMGLISGYVSLGLIGFFIFSTIYMLEPGAFEGIQLNPDISKQSMNSQLLYFSFITLLTIGYGDIVPILPLSQKASLVIGLMGQMYLVIITAITVGKYIGQINHSKNDSEDEKQLH